MIILPKIVLVFVFITGMGLGKQSLAQPGQNEPDYTSKVPKYTFSNSLEEQEGQLKTNPLMLRFMESAKKVGCG